MASGPSPVLTNGVHKCERLSSLESPSRPTAEVAHDEARATSRDRNGLSNGHLRNFPNGYRHAPELPSESSNIEDDGLEPIAVIGMALRFPQDATSPEAFWQMLMKGRSALTEVPKERFNVDAFYRSGTNKTRGIRNRGAHFIKEDLEGFDAPFFSMTPAEVACMDPQQRWLLEVAFQALENAGVPLEKAVGSKTSVHVGSFGHEYEMLLSRDSQMQAKHKATGAATTMLANRLSWFYDFTGPSIVLDTACSSSLIALHLACQSLRNKESTMGVVGGSNLCFDLEGMMSLTDLDFLSPDSKCYSFDYRANGYARGEGIGVVIIKPLSKALEDGDTIRAVIRGTGSNQDGKTPGITQPSSKSQERLIRETYDSGKLDLASTRYFEAHGTGTPLGDPLEASAIRSTFSHTRTPTEPLYIGAVKSNIGHLEGASGIAGLIKTVLVLEEGVIPPNIWFERPNPKITMEDGTIKFPLEPTPWPTNGLRRASVNSFGIGGSNAHAVLDDAYNYLRLRSLHGKHCTAVHPPRPSTFDAVRNEASPVLNGADQGRAKKLNSEVQPRLFVWSASEQSGLNRLAMVYHDHLKNLPSHKEESEYIADLAYTLSEKRSRMPWKSFTVAKSLDELIQHLEQGLTKPVRSTRTPKIGFVFTGQGAHWHAMGRELLKHSVFRESLEKAECAFRSLGSTWLLIDELLRDEETSNLTDPALSQPICTALQIALVELLLSWGITPAAVVGHSSGEIAAAYCAGGLSRDSAWKVAFYRGLVAAWLTKSSREAGAMMSVGLSAADMDLFFQQIRSEDGFVSVGCINSPNNVTISGSKKQIDALATLLERDHVFFRKLNVNVAYHSQSMREVASIYEMLIRNVEAGGVSSERPLMFSTVTGMMISPKELTNSEYWIRNMVSPVKFLQAVNQMSTVPSKKLAKKLKASEQTIAVDHFLELGPHAALKGPLRDILNDKGAGENISYSSMLIRGRSAIDTALQAAGCLYCLGYPVELARTTIAGENLSSRRMLPNLPAYPFNHTRKYWLESRLSKCFRFRKFPHHELLGTPASDWNPLEASWRNIITSAENPWIKDHKVNGSVVYPAAGILVMAIEAARQITDSATQPVAYQFKDVTFYKALVVPQSGEIEVQFYVRPAREKSGAFLAWHEFRLCVYENEEWSDICQGAIAVECVTDLQAEPGKDRTEISNKIRRNYDDGAKACRTVMTSKQLYLTLEKTGISYGSLFQSVRDIHCSQDGGATAIVNLRDWMSKTSENNIRPHVLHPAALDAILQVSFAGFSQGGKKQFSAMVPTRIPALTVSAFKDGIDTSSKATGSADTTVKVYAESKLLGYRHGTCSITALNADNGRPCVVGEFESTSLAGLEISASTDFGSRRLCYNMAWKPDITLLDNEQISSYCSAATSIPVASSAMEVEENRLICYLALLKANDKALRRAISPQKPHLLKYVDWMEDQLSKYAASNLPDSWAKWMDLANQEGALENLYDKIDKTSAEGRLIVRVARNLRSILEGDIDALDLLFNERLMDEYYRYIHDSSSGFQEVALCVDAYAHKNPDLKILEIGAGTGGATEEILHTLADGVTGEYGIPRFSEYAFTDISPSFFESAKDKFSAHIDRMKFLTLDIGRDPLRQGFEPASYDFIIASNVLHATPNLKITLENTRRLLKPGGKLILYEYIQPSYILPGFIFGLLPGWWLGTEDIRKLSPLLTENNWNEKLSQSGFSGIDISFHGHLGDGLHVTSAMISTASKATAGSSIPRNSIILITGNSARQISIAGQLKSQLEEMGYSNCKAISTSEIASVDFRQAMCIFLPELEQPYLHNIVEEAYAGLQNIVSSAQGLLWTTSVSDESTASPANDMIIGLSRCLRAENSGLKVITLALEDSHDASRAVRNILKVFSNTLGTCSEEFEMEYVENGGVLCTNRVVEATEVNRHIFQKTATQSPEPLKFHQVPSRPLKLTIGSPGMLDTLHFVDDPVAGQPVAPDEVEVEVKASGLNFKDVLMALGQDDSGFIGLECAGVVSQAGSDTQFEVGDRVFCAAASSMATYARCKAAAAAKIPKDMTFTTAAGLPVTHFTACYALRHRAQLRHGESILIHSGAGGLGQACIQFAKLLNAHIFVTVGSEDKRKLLIDLYDIPEDHIFSSRTPAFAQRIRDMTNGRGVDVIVNSLAGEALNASWECIAPFGRFLETGKRDMLSGGKLSMFPFSKSATFIGIDLLYLLQDTHSKDVIPSMQAEIMSLVKGNKVGVSSPLNVVKASNIEEAFRYLQSGKSKGKTVIEFHDEDVVPTVPSMLPTYDVDSNATYLIAGGLGGIGRSIARWMASRNAKNLILLSRSGAHSDAARTLLDELKAKGVNVATPPCDVSNMQALSSALAECSKTMPPIKGCIQASMVLEDAAFAHMSVGQFNTAVKPKVDGSWNLHTLLPKGMDFFILLSSLSGVVGLHGQSNYACGNTYQDGLARYRVSRGEKAVSLDLPPILSMGYLAERERLPEGVRSQAYIGMEESEFDAMLDYYCNPALPLLSPQQSQVVIGLESPAALQVKDIEVPDWMTRPMFKQLYQIHSHRNSSAQNANKAVNYEVLFRTAESLAEVSSLIVDGLRTKLAKTLAIETENIDTNRPMHTYGVDSLAAVEVRTWFRKVIGADVTVFEILGNGSIASLGQTVASRSRFVTAELKNDAE